MTPRFLGSFALALVLASGLAAAQAPAPPLVQDQPPLPGRKNQKVEHLHVEDKGAVIDEVRYAGESQSIRVQPKGGAPAYEFQPTDMARRPPRETRGGIGDAKGDRVWNVMNF